MSARFEIVRTDAGWHSRFRAANGRIVWSTEVYTRERACLRAIEMLYVGRSGHADVYWFDERGDR